MCVLCCFNALTPLATLVCRIIAFSGMNNSAAGCLSGLGEYSCVSAKWQGKISSSAECLSKHVCSLAAVVSSLFFPSFLHSGVFDGSLRCLSHLSFFPSLSIFWPIRLLLFRSPSLSSQILPLSSFILFLHRLAPSASTAQTIHSSSDILFFLFFFFLTQMIVLYSRLSSNSEINKPDANVKTPRSRT